MKFQIVEGPAFVEVAQGIVDIVEGRRPVFVFKVKATWAHADCEDITVTVKKIFLKQNHVKPRFLIVGKVSDGDKCQATYRPINKHKGLVRLTD